MTITAPAERKKYYQATPDIHPGMDRLRHRRNKQPREKLYDEDEMEPLRYDRDA